MLDRDALIELERSSVRRQAAALGLTYEALVQQLADARLSDIAELRHRLIEFGGDAEIEAQHFGDVATRLEAEPEYVIEERHDVAQGLLEHALSDLREWLPRCPDAMAMIRHDLLEGCIASDKADGSLEWLSDCVLSRLHNIQVFVPYMGGYNAGITSDANLNVVVVHHGIHDLLYASLHQVVGFATETTEQRAIGIRRLRGAPDDLAACLKALRSIRDMACGRQLRALALDFTLSTEQMHLLHLLLRGAVDFILFHEFAHVIGMMFENPHFTELACDEFAARVIVGTGDEARVCGMVAALHLTQGLLHFERRGHRSTTHPAISTRIKHIAVILDEKNANLSNAFDALLDAPTRLMEEEVFQVETTEIVRRELIRALETATDLGLDADDAVRIGAAISDAAITLPDIFEDALVSIQVRGEERFRVIRFDIAAALSAAASAAGGVISGGGGWAIGAAVLACITALNGVARPLSPTEGVVLLVLHESPSRSATRDEIAAAVARQTRGVPGSDPAALPAALQSLQALGCIRESNATFTLADRVLVWYRNRTPSL